ncbi:winged helix-turn-helix transcriptional regulator [Ferroplasma sp.]|uniref:winged helix-turn-helix transcriptional regulator n=1 Tax=Ferroplasma sp. TaxID=2591003 RepID=UPI00307F9472
MVKNRENACMIYDNGKTLCIDYELPMFALLGKRYTLLILGVIGNNSTRKNFNDILNSIPGSSRTIIAKRLKELINAGIIKRNRNKIVSYELTEAGNKIRKGIICFLESVDSIG